MQLPVAKSGERVGPVSCKPVDGQVNDPAAVCVEEGRGRGTTVAPKDTATSASLSIAIDWVGKRQR